MSEAFQYRWQQLAHRLMRDLARDPQVDLPGIRALGEKYQVSRVTVEHAFRYMERLDVITAASPGKKREIKRDVLLSVLGRKEAEQKRMLFLTKDPEHHPAFMTKVFFDLLHHRCEREKISLNYLQVPASAEATRQMVGALNPDGVVMHVLAQEHVRELAQLALPAVSLGTAVEGVPSMSTSYGHLLMGAFHCAWQAGHQRVTAPLWNKPAALRQLLGEALEPAFERAGCSFSLNYHLPSISGTGPEDYGDYLHRAFQHTPPTCLILGNFSQYLMAVSYLMQQGLRIPDDVSVILLSHDTMFDDVLPTIAHFRHPVECTVDRSYDLLVRQIEGESVSGHEEVDPVWVLGDSLKCIV
ncbi:LacI family DNA-binding transcriptional regulator [Verrucomicrobiaceae bacterium N1E253]|uniref:LacI family DNA-binding transcriptional regulator n=1 Tax=Oceaniferula marina TaxID=2748318 RepID=A0A851GEM0_9BACT|nr:substrate-binding domain-containing protein [Oceaniferula marina]NWK55866.1 LacI family DNA-binding transcriptional regulator [Oceaniferula marina]